MGGVPEESPFAGVSKSICKSDPDFSKLFGIWPPFEEGTSIFAY
jgi:hypothetical protein